MPVQGCQESVDLVAEMLGVLDVGATSGVEANDAHISVVVRAASSAISVPHLLVEIPDLRAYLAMCRPTAHVVEGEAVIGMQAHRASLMFMF